MEMKKAIENIEDIYDCHSNDRACNDEERVRIEKEKNKIIELLQRGEKFEFIFSDMYYLIQHLLDGIYLYNIKLSVKSDVEYIERAFEIIEEKYFPKPKENLLEELLEKTLWKITKEFVEKNTSVVLKCMEKAEKDKNENKMEDRPIKQSRMDYMEKGARIGKSREGKNERKTP